MSNSKENAPEFRKSATTKLFSTLDKNKIVYAIKGEPGTLTKWCNARTRKDLDIWLHSDGWDAVITILGDLNFIPVYSWTERNQLTPNSCIFLFLTADGYCGGSIDFSIGDLRVGRVTLADQKYVSNHVKRMNDGYYFDQAAFLLDFFVRRLVRGKTFTHSQTSLIERIWSRLPDTEQREFLMHVERILSRNGTERISSILNSSRPQSAFRSQQTLVRYDAMLKALLSSPKEGLAILLDMITRKRAPRRRELNPAGARPRPTTIALLGTDGAGKSSLAKSTANVLMALSVPTRVEYFGRVRGGLFGNRIFHSMGSVLKKSSLNKYDSSQSTKRPPGLPNWSRYIASWFYLFDYSTRHTTSFLRRIATRKCCIYDRYSYDLFLMPHASSLASRIAMLVFPKPDILCILNPPKAIILSRNDENSSLEIERQQDVLQHLYEYSPRSFKANLYVSDQKPIHILSTNLAQLVLLLAMRSQIDNKALVEAFLSLISRRVASEWKLDAAR